MDDTELRLECLRLADDGEKGMHRASPQEVVERARVYVDFLAGTNDAEIIRVARDLADKVKPS
jgi:hypothetical protein